MLVPNKKPPSYKEHDIDFSVFALWDDVKIIHWLANMKLYVYEIVE